MGEGFPNDQRGDEQSSSSKHCSATRADGSQCRAWRLRSSRFCLSHDPERLDAMARSRRLGGLRRRRHVPSATGAAHDVATVDGLIDLLGTACQITLGCDPSLAQAKTLGQLVLVGLKAQELALLSDRVTALEQASATHP
jgi:hypothetical protein